MPADRLQLVARGRTSPEWNNIATNICVVILSSALRQSTRAVLEAFDTVEYDAHKLDLRLKVVLEQDPLGGEHSIEIERLWCLAVIDVATRCVLGWTLAFGRECNRFDAIETIKRALVPAGVPEVTLPGLRLMRSGGFVSQVLPQTQFACWRQIRLDNARAHLALTDPDSEAIDAAGNLLLDSQADGKIVFIHYPGPSQTVSVLTLTLYNDKDDPIYPVDDTRFVPAAGPTSPTFMLFTDANNTTYRVDAAFKAIRAALGKAK